jgi:2-dehydropantoate 2-reductase
MIGHLNDSASDVVMLSKESGMNRLENICIAGVGAVGIIIADRMTERLGKGRVRVVADQARIARYREQGLFLNGKKEDFNYLTYDQSRELQSPDLVIIATKNLQFGDVIGGLENQIKPGCIMISLLNGIVSEEILKNAFPSAHVLYSFARGINSEHVGNHVSCNSFGCTYTGEEDGILSNELEAVRNLFVDCGLNIETPSDILHQLYSKFALNSAFNTVSAICMAGYGDFSSCHELEELIDEAFLEVKAVSLAHAGVRLTDEDWSDTKKMIASLEYEGKTSMYQDMEASRPTENKWFTGTVVELGKKYGIPTPVCRSLYLTASGCEFVRLRRAGQR